MLYKFLSLLITIYNYFADNIGKLRSLLASIVANPSEQVLLKNKLGSSQTVPEEDLLKTTNETVQLMPLFHQRIKPRSCQRPLIVGSLGKN